jgi:carboxymethylenebutenolidase
MGGGYSLDLAIHDPKLAATVINYGHLATEDATLKQINAPILGIFGALDQGISPDAVHKFEQQMKGLNKSVEVVIFPDAGHAFENPNNKSGYRAEDAAKAWADTVNFLSQKLKKGAS